MAKTQECPSCDGAGSTWQPGYAVYSQVRVSCRRCGGAGKLSARSAPKVRKRLPKRPEMIPGYTRAELVAMPRKKRAATLLKAMRDTLNPRRPHGARERGRKKS